LGKAGAGTVTGFSGMGLSRPRTLLGKTISIVGLVDPVAGSVQVSVVDISPKFPSGLAVAGVN